MAEEYLTDDEQLDAVKHFIVEYAPWLLSGLLLGAGAFFGLRYFHSYTDDRALKAGSQFSAMTTAVQAHDLAKSRQIADGLIKDYVNSPYADQAHMVLARLDIDEGHSDKAVLSLTHVMNESKDTELQQIARLRLARVFIDQGKSDEAIKTLSNPIPAGFAMSYHEVRGDAYLAKKDVANATTEYRAALAAADPNASNTALLELKIQDLGAAPQAPVIATSADTLHKATP